MDFGEAVSTSHVAMHDDETESMEVDLVAGEAPARTPRTPITPSALEKETHELTHEPFCS